MNSLLTECRYKNREITPMRRLRPAGMLRRVAASGPTTLPIMRVMTAP